MTVLHRGDTALLTEGLQIWLDGRAALPSGKVANLRVPSGGYSGENVLFDVLTDDAVNLGTYVARFAPADGNFFFETDISVHYRILEALGDTGVRAPGAVALETGDDNPLGRPFFIMEGLPGKVPPEEPHYTVAGWLAEMPAAAQARAYRSAIEQIAALHRLDPASLELGFLPVLADPELATQPPGIDADQRLFERFADRVLASRSLPVIDAARTWLSDNHPGPAEVRVTWGDAKFINLLYVGGEVTGMLDWELASVSPPESEVAFWFVHHESVTGEAGHPDLASFPSEAQAIECYEHAAGRTLGDLTFYKMWHRYRIAVMAVRLADLLEASGRIRPDPRRPARLRAIRTLERHLSQV